MLNFKKNLIFTIVLIYLIKPVFAFADFSGRWCWDNNNNVSNFSIVINKKGLKYYGGYFAVAQSGNKIDDNEDAFSFKKPQKNTIKTKFKAGISGSNGLIQLKLLDDKKIDWLVLRLPKGEIYVPHKATLRRC